MLVKGAPGVGLSLGLNSRHQSIVWKNEWWLSCSLSFNTNAMRWESHFVHIPECMYTEVSCIIASSLRLCTDQFTEHLKISSLHWRRHMISVGRKPDKYIYMGKCIIWIHSEHLVLRNINTSNNIVCPFCGINCSTNRRMSMWLHIHGYYQCWVRLCL